jgi:predicted acetyltransferase
VNSVQLIPATAGQAPILANLLELYAHDFSEFYGVEVGEDGRFGYKSLPLYWSEPDRHPFLVRVNGKLAGLVLVKRATPDCWDMAEFFVLRGYRRNGNGTVVAQEVWRRFPGRWEVRVMQANASGQRFWAAAIAAFTGEVTDAVLMEHNGVAWSKFSFESKVSV